MYYMKNKPYIKDYLSEIELQTPHIYYIFTLIVYLFFKFYSK